jgi:hypothetical protein
VITVRLEGRDRPLRLHSVDGVRACQSDLAAVYGVGRAFCSCDGGKHELVVCRREDTRTRSVAYYLRGRPGDRHADGCLYGAVPGESAAAKDRRRSTVLVDGGWSVNASLADREPAADRAPRAHGSGISSPRLALLHLARLLWIEANLDADEPVERRTWLTVRERLLAAAKAFKTPVGTLQRHLAVVPALPPGPVDASLRGSLRRAFVTAAAERLRLVVIGELGESLGPLTNGSIFLKGLTLATGYRLVVAGGELHEQTRKRYAIANSLFGQGRARLLAVALVEVHPERSLLRAIRLTLMATSGRFIPVDSRPELELVDRAAAELRRYRKPLIVADDDVLPDLELLDVGEAPFVCEVLGRDDPTYLANVARKEALYDARYGRGGWWRWFPAREVMPPLPAATARRSPTPRSFGSTIT